MGVEGGGLLNSEKEMSRERVDRVPGARVVRTAPCTRCTCSQRLHDCHLIVGETWRGRGLKLKVTLVKEFPVTDRFSGSRCFLASVETVTRGVYSILVTLD